MGERKTARAQRKGEEEAREGLGNPHREWVRRARGRPSGLTGKKVCAKKKKKKKDPEQKQDSRQILLNSELENGEER